MSRADEAIAHLVRLGWVEDPPLGGQSYRVFNHRERPHKMFVASNGEVRMGPTWDSSWPLFEGSLTKQIQWLRDTELFCRIGGTAPKPRVAHRDEDIA